MVFNNKVMVRDAIKDYEMEMKKNVDLKKNDGKMMGVKLSHDQAYGAKRRAMDLIQGVGMDQFTHLRSYVQALHKSNPNINVVVQCADSNGGLSTGSSECECSYRATPLCEAYLWEFEAKISWVGIKRDYMECRKSYKNSSMGEGNGKDEKLE
ncbi:hypothetical protein KIW84_013889 [Lathyrus oleraceus]|uniref:Uncharacterized protein n=1 Tax=Pisum sativum TaxID=3888 RepID=A0A9D5BLP2_PEA|nr:hypothetical protein KIW84_013889 [Pisum sativum]